MKVKLMKTELNAIYLDTLTKASLNIFSESRKFEMIKLIKSCKSSDPLDIEN